MMEWPLTMAARPRDASEYFMMALMECGNFAACLLVLLACWATDSLSLSLVQEEGNDSGFYTKSSLSR